jgi:hypothetical protein
MEKRKIKRRGVKTLEKEKKKEKNEEGTFCFGLFCCFKATRPAKKQPFHDAAK